MTLISTQGHSILFSLSLYPSLSLLIFYLYSLFNSLFFAYFISLYLSFSLYGYLCRSLNFFFLAYSLFSHSNYNLYFSRATKQKITLTDRPMPLAVAYKWAGRGTLKSHTVDLKQKINNKQQIPAISSPPPLPPALFVCV